MSLVDTGIKSKLSQKRLKRWAEALLSNNKRMEADFEFEDANTFSDEEDESELPFALTEDLEWPLNVPVQNLSPEFFSSAGINLAKFNRSLGSVGRGNHFAELQIIEEVYDEKEFSAMGLDLDALYILAHSGSRGLGKEILDWNMKANGTKGLFAGSEIGNLYKNIHDQACAWAKRNRREICKNIIEAIGAENSKMNRILDIWHNNVEEINDPEFGRIFLHRKGAAAPSTSGPIVIRGSRGDFSYIVKPINSSLESAYSLAHGAGRKWQRGKAFELGKKRYPNTENLKQTHLNSYVVCASKQLLYEEAPEAYKSIEDVITDLENFKLIQKVAKLRPLITYKTSSSD